MTVVGKTFVATAAMARGGVSHDQISHPNARTLCDATDTVVDAIPEMVQRRGTTMKARIGIRLAAATALALGGLTIGAAVRPQKAEATPAVCAEVHRNQNGNPVPVLPWICIGSVNPPCTTGYRFNHPGTFGIGFGFEVCLDLS